jgi:D-alanine-D-alanine ligase
MVERFVPGKELTCAVIGDTALGVIDIVSKSSSWYDYTAKYAPGGSQHILPAEIPDVYRKCQQLCAHGAQALGCRGVSRSDFRTTTRQERAN